ncbi:PKD domain-containing protein [Arthrobacter sp. 260]|uniref:PKD domain-containing protein n=1 Tax=Arthrobacter sp. 260 TaxID=2735314 RepID=UPI001C1274E3|nr:PKD domain-containing protein [Arthrobacter sp. 260]
MTISLMVFVAPGAQSDTAPVNPGNPRTPVTVSSDPLPTAQINGVAWQQVVVGNTVYVAGNFSTARPSGAAPNTQTVTRRNILAYNLTTGALLTGFAPTLNGQALTITAPPDGSRIYVGGDFTSVSGVNRSRIVALDPSTGAVISSFDPRIGGSVRALAATNSTVYVGGTFGSVGTASRSRLAAVQASNGALLPWNPNANNRVNALVISPDQSSVVIGGAFTTLNGSNRPGYGLGRVNATTGASQSLGVNDVIRNGGNDSAILSLSSDGTSFYGTGYIFGTGGNLEGAFAGNWSNHSLKWVEDCHGDTYGIWASSTAVYTAGHAHYCGNIGGFPQTEPRTWWRALAFSKAVTGTATRDIYGYPSFTGQPTPNILSWFPQLDTGTASGQSQGPWAVAGNEQYVVMAGEFRNVNNRPQQGLVRFAVSSIAPNDDGPRVSGANMNPSLAYLSAGTVRVRWTANWDRDNENLTYRVIRDRNAASPVHVVDRGSTFWQRPQLEFTDTGLSAGQHDYRIEAYDPFGNVARSDYVTVNVPVGSSPAANQSPSASFTQTVNGLSVGVNGTGSADPDGTIASYAWNFGDGTTASGPTASRTYDAAGTYTIRLTVTDDDGATGTTTRSITVAGDDDPPPPPPPGAAAADAFERSVSSGWGTADAGGAWTTNSNSFFSVNQGSGAMNVHRAGAGPWARLTSVATTTADARVNFSLDKVANSGGTFVTLVGRQVGTSEYRSKVKVAANGSVAVDITRAIGSTVTTLISRQVSGLTYQAGDDVAIRFEATGTSPTTLRTKVWRVGQPEPSAWLASVTDSASQLQSAGGVGLTTYISSGSTNAPVVARFDDLTVASAEGP